MNNNPDISQDGQNSAADAANLSFEPEGEPAKQDMGDLAPSKDEGFSKIFKNPATGGAITGAIFLGAAAVTGALESALGAGAAYVAYRVIQRRRRH